MDKITIYTDGSYNKNHTKCAGIAFLYLHSESQVHTIGYSSIFVNNSSQAEILAVIYALKYLKYLNIECDYIEVRCDDINIIDFFNSKKFIKYPIKEWKKSDNEFMIDTKQLWYEFTCIINNFKGSKLIFKKEKRGSQCNKVVHRYAQTASALNNAKDKLLYINKGKKMYSEFDSSEMINFLEIKEETACTLFINDVKLCEIAHSHSGKKSKKESEKIIKWFDVIEQNTIDINTSNIILTEDTHLKCQRLKFNGSFKKYAKSMYIDKPIAVRKVSSEKYALVMGLTRLVVAKVLGIPTIPCIVTEFNYSELKQKYELNELIVGAENSE